MYAFKEVISLYQKQFDTLLFPQAPERLYGAITYFLENTGKKVRPALCLMGNELFGNIHQDTFLAGHAVEMFHNFTLMHDDIMDDAVLRRGRPAVHIKYDEDTAILSGDVLLVHAYKQLNRIGITWRRQINELFSDTAIAVCEGQQLDIDFERMNIDDISFEAYLQMITLKTSVLLAASVRMGTIIGGASPDQQEFAYEFGKNLGIAFQIRDDLLDAFGHTAQTGKKVGGDILENKKTFLWLKAMEFGSDKQRESLRHLMVGHEEDKVPAVLEVYEACGVNQWAEAATSEYINKANEYLQAIDVPDYRKEPLRKLTVFLLERQH